MYCLCIVTPQLNHLVVLHMINFVCLNMVISLNKDLESIEFTLDLTSGCGTKPGSFFSSWSAVSGRSPIPWSESCEGASDGWISVIWIDPLSVVESLNWTCNRTVSQCWEYRELKPSFAVEICDITNDSEMNNNCKITSFSDWIAFSHICIPLGSIDGRFGTSFMASSNWTTKNTKMNWPLFSATHH